MRRHLRLIAALLLALLAPAAHAEDSFKIGLIVPLTGPFTSTGQEIQAAAKLYLKQHGDMVAGRKVELIIRDDAGVPDTTKRLATELVVKDHVSVLAGMGLHLGMEITGWPPENIEDMAKKLEQELLG
jgi:branched-chain amino acid transport system substrate-binding protein